MSELKLPAWIRQEENYAPSADRDFFISRSLLRLMGVLFQIRKQADRQAGSRGLAAGSLFFALLLVVLIVSTQQSVFLLTVLALELVVLCVMPAGLIRSVLRNALAAFFFSGLLMLPAAFLSGAPAVVLIPCKTFLTVTCLSLLTGCLSWHAITASLRVVHVPGMFIQILDLTLKYIVLLGEISLQMLYALKLRSIGRNPRKSKAFSAVLGVTFLKSREMSQEMYEAMVCRCFTGEYPQNGQASRQRGDGLLFLAAVFLLVFYGYIEGWFL